MTKSRPTRRRKE